MNLRRDVDEAVASSLERIVLSGSYRKYAAAASAELSSQLARLASVAEALLFSSATAGLEACLRAAGVGVGSRVALSAYDYPGNFWAIERAGARPLLIDVEPDSWAMNSAALVDALSAGGIEAVVVSHLHGQRQNVRKLREICDSRDVLLVEDACQAIGTLLASENENGQRALVGHMGLISFGGGKVISAGRGGALLSNDETLMQKIRVASGAGSGPYAMSELQAWVVLAQLPWLARIDASCCRFFGEFAVKLQESDIGVATPWGPGDHRASTRNSFYQAGVVCADAAQAAKCLQMLVENGCPAGSGFPGFHRRSKRRCDRVGDLANTASIVERTLVLHHDVALSGETVPSGLAEWMLDRTKES